jgi:drug/metabolite transporter (DMT)-like permease
VVLQPIVTTLLAVPLLGEIPTIWQGIGGAIALVGIYIVNQAHQRSSPVEKRNQLEPPSPNL